LLQHMLLLQHLLLMQHLRQCPPCSPNVRRRPSAKVRRFAPDKCNIQSRTRDSRLVRFRSHVHVLQIRSVGFRWDGFTALRFSGVFGNLGTTLDPPMSILGKFWDHVGPTDVHRSGSILGPRWTHLGPITGPFCSVMGPLYGPRVLACRKQTQLTTNWPYISNTPRMYKLR
jgi:hypothetical protein